MYWFSSSQCMYLLVALTSLSTAQNSHRNNSFVQIRNEYCDRGNLCLTSFNWCQTGTQYSPSGNFTTGYCDRNGIGGPGDGNFSYSPGSGALSGITVFLNPFYDLTWINADPTYPVQVQLTFGPRIGPVNNSVPLWSTNTTEPSLVFRFRDIFQELSDQNPNSNLSYVGYAVGETAFFTVSQPERPANGINTTEDSNEFVISNFDLPYLTREYEDEIETMQARTDRRWRLGVGLGVGLGVPIFLVAAFVLGRVSGKRSARKTLGGKDVPGKRISDTTEVDRSAAAS